MLSLRLGVLEHGGLAKNMRRQTTEALKTHVLITLVAVVIPTLDLLQNGASFFIAHGWTGGSFFLWLVLLFSIPFCLWLLIFTIISSFATRAVKSTNAETMLTVAVVVALGANLTSNMNQRWMLLVTGFTTLAVVWLVLRSALHTKKLVGPLLFGAVSVTFWLTLQLRAVYSDNKLQLEQADVRWHPEIKNVFVIIYDEMPSRFFENASDGSLSATLLPKIAAFAAEATLFPRARTVSTNTYRAVPSIFSGRKARFVEAIAPNFPNSLFTALSPVFDIVGYEPYTRICPANICDRPSKIMAKDDTAAVSASIIFSRLSSGFIDTAVVVSNAVTPPPLAKRFLPTLDGKWDDFLAVDKSISANDFLPWAKLRESERQDQRAFNAKLESREGPTFWFLHWLLPHAHDHYPDGQRFHRSLQYADDNPQNNKPLSWVRQQAMWSQFRFMDDQFGEFIDRLKDLNIYDESLIIFTSDHGMSLLGDRRGSDFEGLDLSGEKYESWLSTLYVPLIVKFPRQTHGIIDNRLASIVDIAPTVLDVVGYPTEHYWSKDGKSLRTKQNDWIPAPTYWDRFTAPAEEMGVPIEKTDSNMHATWGDIETTLNFEELVFDSPGDYFRKLSLTPNFNNIVGSIKLEDRNIALPQPWIFIDGNVETFESFSKNAFVVVRIGSRYCGFLAIYGDSTASDKTEGFLSRDCIEEVGLSNLRFLLANSESILGELKISQ